MLMKRTLVLIVLFAVSALAQVNTLPSSRPKKKERGPRAIAVVRWQADEKGNGHPVLLPVAIIDEGKVYDASIYRTSPEPMALEPGTVYEAQHHGLPVGLFTIGSASHSNADGHPWIALGKWKLDIFDPDGKKGGVIQSKATIGDPRVDESKLPPVEEGEMHRTTTQVYDESGRPVDNPKDDAPPTLGKNGKSEPVERRPQVSTAPTDQPKDTGTSDDPDRPKLKKGPPAANTPTATPAPSDQTHQISTGTHTQTDPNRPKLKRGRPSGEQDTAESGDAPIAREVISRASVNRPRTYEMAAVSDADLTRIPREYEFKTSLAEQQSYLRKMQALVDAEIAPKAAPQSRVSLRKPKGPDPARFADVRFEMLDLNANNTPYFVLTGTYVLSATQRVPFMLVAHGDYDGNPHKMLFQKNDRYELIDAVDLDGDGPGELLFRHVQSDGSTFVLYRASIDGLTEVFRGGTAE
jgi:hypothetical protein